MKAYIHVYTGNGKGKTNNENIAIARYLKNITVQQFGLGCFIVNTPTDDDIRAAGKGLDKISKIIEAGEHDLVILDEVNIALHYKLIDVNQLIEIMRNKPDHVELVLTGRYAPQEIIDISDLVTEMKEVKHYYQQGIEARKGIEY